MVGSALSPPTSRYSCRHRVRFPPALHAVVASLAVGHCLVFIGCTDRIAPQPRYESFHDAAEDIWENVAGPCAEQLSDNESARVERERQYWLIMSHIESLAATEPQCLEIWIDMATCFAEHVDELEDPCNAQPLLCPQEDAAIDEHVECNCADC